MSELRRSSKVREWLTPKTATGELIAPEPEPDDEMDRDEKHPGSKARVPQDMFLATLRANAGLKAQTAEALGVSYAAVWQRVRKMGAAYDALVEETREKVTDIAEAHFVNAVRKGGRHDVRDWLKFHARHRGYRTTAEISGPGGGPIPVSGVDVTIRLVRSAEEQA